MENNSKSKKVKEWFKDNWKKVIGGTLIAIGTIGAIGAVLMDNNDEEDFDEEDMSDNPEKKLYKIRVKWSDDEIEEEGYFDSEEEAEEYAHECISNCRLGNEILHLSNPGDYPLDDEEDPEIEVTEL